LKKGDFLWGAALALIVAILVIPTSHQIFMKFVALHPYLAGFIKFSILATMGELLAGRVLTGNWNNLPKGLGYKAIVWGFLGMLNVLMFDIFANGVKLAQAKDLLPGGTGLIYAFLVSLVNNITFASTLMGIHKIADTFIDLKYEISNVPITLERVIKTIDWNTFFSFVVFKTIPFFWLPAHTITFMLPAENRVLFAAALSMVLGLLLAVGKKKSQKVQNVSSVEFI
jgi:hypothetical protein